MMAYCIYGMLLYVSTPDNLFLVACGKAFDNQRFHECCQCFCYPLVVDALVI
uniref:Uncharacterized protein n=1 Tax=Rhizophora mucronata TaxID=61149 RepID=A0A2P2IMD8_RHIMU